MPLPISLGLCCLNTELRAQKPTVFNSRTCTRKTFTVKIANERALQNIKDLIPMIEYNKKHGIKCFRLTSNFFPHFTDDKTESYEIGEAHIQELKKAGELIKKYNQRVLMHPGQYNQVGSLKQNVLENTIHDLCHHADILNHMGIDNNGVLIVHGGGTYGDKEKTIARWVENFIKLPEKIRDRLVLEHCERSYSLQDVLQISKILEERGYNLPVVFDSHHYECWDKLNTDYSTHDIKDLMKQVVETWKDRRPVMHISNQGDGRIGHHSDFITHVPDVFRYVAEELNIEFDLEVEAKKKEQAIFKMRQDFPKLFSSA